MKKVLAISMLAAVLFLGAAPAQAATVSEVRDRFMNVYDRMASVMDKFHTLIVEANERGRDVSAAMAAYEQAKIDRDAAKAEVDELKAMMDGATAPTPEIRTQAKETKDALRKLFNDIRNIRDHVRVAIEAIRENQGNNAGDAQ